MIIEIVDLPINSMVIFHSFLYVYQRDPEGMMFIPVTHPAVVPCLTFSNMVIQ